MKPAERHEQWRRIACDQVDVVVGARSAIFAPVRQLGLIVIDEEHETSFKQDISAAVPCRVMSPRGGPSGLAFLWSSARRLPPWKVGTASRRGEGQVIHLPERANQLPLAERIDRRSPPGIPRSGTARLAKSSLVAGDARCVVGGRASHPVVESAGILLAYPVS